VAFAYDNGAVGSLYYSREVRLLQGSGSRAHGPRRDHHFESNGLFVVVRDEAFLGSSSGFVDIRGYQAMYRDFHRSFAKSVHRR